MPFYQTGTVCVGAGVFGCVYDELGFYWVYRGGYLCIWGGKCVLGSQEGEISVGVCIFSFM